jgi:hypothetical protein
MLHKNSVSLAKSFEVSGNIGGHLVFFPLPVGGQAVF